MRLVRPVDGTVFGLEATVLTMRRVTAGDRCAALAMHRRCSAETLRCRYLGEDDWQRYGLGLRLSQEALAMPERQGRPVWLLAQADNSPALALARRLGHRGRPRIVNAFAELEIADASLWLRSA